MIALRSASAWWRARNTRERAMLLVMSAALAAFAWWYGLLVPLRLWRAEAQGRYDRAAVEWLAVHDAGAAIRDLSAGRPRDPATLAAAVLQAAEDAGVAVSRQRHDAQGRLALEVDAADAPALFEWLDTLQRQHAIAADRVLVERRDGRLRAELGFRTATEQVR